MGWDAGEIEPQVTGSQAAGEIQLQIRTRLRYAVDISRIGRVKDICALTQPGWNMAVLSLELNTIYVYQLNKLVLKSALENKLLSKG